ncbi:MAG: mechanosensitive ion channel [Deltaproteobacteria bacterium]|nr:mechanosensitive ion channel [Deltaproteobacteria bacterium]
MKFNFDVETINTLIIKYATKLGFFILGVFVTFFVAKWVKWLVIRALAKAGIDVSLQNFFGKLARISVIVAGLVSCLGILGIETASFAAILAAAGFAIGMALQGTLGHFAAGVMLLVFKPFRIGDVITTAGESGTVATIDIFNTALDTPDNQRIIIPNGNVFGNVIKNTSFHAKRRVSVAVGTEYAADMDQTREVLLAAAQNTEHVLSEPAAAVVITGLGASSVDWSVRVWVASEHFWPVSDQLIRNVKSALDKAGIGIPFPQMDVHLPTQWTATGANSGESVADIHKKERASSSAL